MEQGLELAAAHPSWAALVIGGLALACWWRLPRRWRKRTRKWAWRHLCRICSWLWDEIKGAHQRSRQRPTTKPKPWPVEPGGPTVLYRHFNAGGELLYVGITGAHRGKQRWHEHAETKAWWSEVAHSTVSDPYPTRADALYAEACAIRDERPRYNIARPNPDLIGRH